MIDISDGLSGDLAHICRASGVGALIESAAVPIAPFAARCGLGPESALNAALHGGEDFELLVTAPPGADLASLSGALTPIGVINERKGRMSITTAGRTEAFIPDSFEHFGQ
jgi:thiamine-monophosphate kinase